MVRVSCFWFWVLGFERRSHGFGFRVSGFGFRVLGFELRASGFGFRVLSLPVSGSGFWVLSSGFSGFGDLGFGPRCDVEGELRARAEAGNRAPLYAPLGGLGDPGVCASRGSHVGPKP